TSDVTGLPNRRAFDEAGRAPAIAMSDVDGLKALNDFAYDAGNALLRAMADALREAGLEAYHDKGDEFLCRGHNTKELHANLERARAILRDRTVTVQQTEGRSLSFTGANFSYGVGKDINEAEWLLKCHKAEREARGEIARGELRGAEWPAAHRLRPTERCGAIRRSPNPPSGSPGSLGAVAANSGSLTRHGIRRVPTRARDVQHQDPALHVVGRQVHSPRKE